MKQQVDYLFIDRDGTLIEEPADEQVDSLEKLQFMPGVFTALNQLQNAGYTLVLISNQDGLGTSSFSEESFNIPQKMMLQIFKSQGIQFEAILICPHWGSDKCDCRKPKLGLVMDYLKNQTINIKNSFVIGDRESDCQLAHNMGIQSIQIGTAPTFNWIDIANTILNRPRTARIQRKTNETNITVDINLDKQNDINIETGIGFFDHMLEQLFKHSGFSGQIQCHGDLIIDDHHTVEDIAIALGEGFKEALGNKRGIERYGFLLPMDEAQAQIAIDLSGRAYCRFEGSFQRDSINGLSTEMIPHFFYSFAQGLQGTLQISVTGSNSHHQAEACFKGLGRVLRQAIKREGNELPSTKGVL